MSYVIQADAYINCVYMEGLDNFVCSDLNIYTEIHNFVVYGQSQDNDGTIIRGIALTVNGTGILGFGSCELSHRS